MGTIGPMVKWGRRFDCTVPEPLVGGVFECLLRCHPGGILSLVIRVFFQVVEENRDLMARHSNELDQAQGE